MGKNNIEVQDGVQLHPKETKEFTNVLLAWDGSPVTKLFLKVNDGCTGYPAYGKGAQYVRIPIQDKDIKSIPVNLVECTSHHREYCFPGFAIGLGGRTSR